MFMVQGTEMTMKRIPRLTCATISSPTRSFAHFFGNAYDGCIMASGKGRRIMVVLDELRQMVVRLFGAVEDGHDHS